MEICSSVIAMNWVRKISYSEKITVLKKYRS